LNKGRLPTVHTTKHIKRPVLPEGAITADGREKVISNITGHVRYVDRKIPTKLDDAGDLAHE